MAADLKTLLDVTAGWNDGPSQSASTWLTTTVSLWYGDGITAIPW